MVTMVLTDEAKLLAHSETSDDDGHEPRVEGFRTRRGLRLEEHHLRKKFGIDASQTPPTKLGDSLND